MRVLVLTSYVPYPPSAGAKIRVSNQMRYVSREHHVTLMCPVRPNSGQTEDAQKLVGEYCTEVRAIPWHKRSKIGYLPHLWRYVRDGEPIGNLTYYYEELATALFQATDTEPFDVVEVHHGYMAPYLDAISPRSQARTIFSLHNVPYVQRRRMMHIERNIVQKLKFFRDWLFKKHATLKYIRRYDRTVVISELDRSILLRDAPGADIVAVPMGMNTDIIAPLGRPAGYCHLLLVGSMFYQPNVDAALFLGRQILPLIRQQIPEAHLFIVGSGPTREVQRLGEETEAITVTGYVDSVMPYYETCCLSLVPLRAGSGIRVKILESMALGRPVVPTTLGCEGLRVSHSENILIADTAADLAAQTLCLMTDPKQWQHIARNGRRLIEQVYDWRATGQQLVQAFGDL